MHSRTVLSIFLGSLTLSHATDVSSPERRQDNPIYASAIQLGYNPAQASYYAAAITQGAVASAFNELNAAGVLAQIAPLTSDPAQYNSMLDAGIASLPADVQAAATSFFVNINSLNGGDGSSGHTFLTVPGTSAGSGAAASTSAPPAAKTTATNPGSLILASVPASLTSSAGSAATQMGASGGATTVTANASSKISSAMAPARTGWALGAVAAGVAGLAIGL